MLDSTEKSGNFCKPQNPHLSRGFAKQFPLYFVTVYAILAIFIQVIDILEHMRRVLGLPSKTFTASLRQRLLEEFDTEYNQLEARLRLQASETVPSEAFRKRLRQRLVADERQTRKIFVAPAKRTWRRAFEVGASVMTIVTLITATVFFGSRPTTLATDLTLLTAFSGDVQLTQAGTQATVVAPDIAITTGTAITTGARSGATVRFFEDSILRLDQNTRVTIENLTPHSARDDLGEVGITILEGRAWVRTFSTDEDYSRLVITLTSENSIVMDAGGALDVTVSKTERSIRVWERSAAALSNGVRAFLSEGKEFLQHGGFNSGMLPIGEASYQEPWVVQNFAADDLLIGTILEEKIDAQRILAENRVASLREHFASPFGEDSDAEIFQLETDFFAMLSHLLVNADNEAALNHFVESVHNVGEKNHDQVVALLASAEKTLSIVLPDSPLFTAKKTIENLKFELEQKPSVIAIEERRTTRLWEARRLAQAGNVSLAEEIVRESSTEAEGAARETISPDQTADILAEKQEQLAALSAITTSAGVTEGVAESLEKETVAESSRIIRPGFPDASTRNTTNQAYEIIASIKKYENITGQKNTLYHHLNSIEDSAENLSLLMEIKNRVPNELVGMVDEKIILILGKERERMSDIKADESSPSPTHSSPTAEPVLEETALPNAVPLASPEEFISSPEPESEEKNEAELEPTETPLSSVENTVLSPAPITPVEILSENIIVEIE